MTRRSHARPLCVLALGSLAVAVGGGCGDSRPPAPRGVLLVSIDSLRADHLSCYGYESATNPGVDTTPTIDRLLAASGTLFERAVSTTSWTLPSHMSMLTGLPNEHHGVRELGLRLGEDKTLLAETFRGAGWRTGGFWSGPNLHPFFGFDRGFETYVDCSTAVIDDAESLFSIQGGMTRDDLSEKSAGLKDVHGSSHVGQTGPKLVDEFTRWFETVGEEERFFAFVHMWDVHYDYEPPAEFDVFDPSYTGDETGVDVTERYPRHERPRPRDLQHIVALYDGEILFTDANVGRMLDALRSADRFDDTLVVLTSDHGEEFREHEMFGHGNTLYEESVRIPLILRYPPAVPAGRRLDVPVSLVDIAPTILELCDLPAPGAIWGRSLMDAVRGELEPRLLPMERTWLRPEDGGIGIQALRGIHAGDHKLIRDTESAGGKTYFFDLARDPAELEPVLTGKLGKGDPRVVAARRAWTELDEGARALIEAPTDMPEELVDALDAAGYIGNDPADPVE